MEDKPIVEHSEDVQDIRDRWKTRRKITWIFVVLFVATVIYGFGFILPEHQKEYTSLYNIIAMVVVGVLSSYFGFATWDDVSKGRNPMNRYNPYQSPQNTRSYHDIDDTPRGPSPTSRPIPVRREPPNGQ